MKKHVVFLAFLQAALLVQARPIWDLARLSQPVKIYSVEASLPVTNDCPQAKNIRPIFLEGEPYHGNPTRVFAWYGLPEGACAEKKVPGMVLVHGGGGTAFAMWVKRWTDRGYAALALDTCGHLPGGRHASYHPCHPWSGPKGWDASFGQVDDAITNQWAYHAVAAVIRAHTFLRDQPEVDARATGLTGISWGGFLTCLTSTYDTRFKFAAPVYGCGFYGLNDAWTAKSKLSPRQFMRWHALWDPSRFLGRGGDVPILWCAGTNDACYPLDALVESYSLLKPTTRLDLSIKLRMKHGHPPVGDPMEIAAFANFYLRGGPRPLSIQETSLEGGVLKGRYAIDGGQTLSQATLLYTCEDNPDVDKCLWQETPAQFSAADTTFSAVLPKGTVHCFVNLTANDGFIASTPVY